MEALKSRY